MRAFDANGVVGTTFRRLRRHCRRRRRGPPFSSSTARSLYSTHPDECNGLDNAKIIIGEQRTSINRDGKLELIEYLMIFLYSDDCDNTRTTSPLRPPQSSALSYHSININFVITQQSTLYSLASALLQASGIIVIVPAVVDAFSSSIFHRRQSTTLWQLYRPLQA